jgi:hypothetical protein
MVLASANTVGEWRHGGLNTKLHYKSISLAVKFVRFINAEAGHWQYPPNCTSAQVAPESSQGLSRVQQTACVILDVVSDVAPVRSIHLYIRARRPSILLISLRAVRAQPPCLGQSWACSGGCADFHQFRQYVADIGELPAAPAHSFA